MRRTSPAAVPASIEAPASMEASTSVGPIERSHLVSGSSPPEPAPRSNPPRSTPPPPHDGSRTLSAVQSLSYIIIIAIFAITFSLQPFRIPSASMEPTLLVGDFLLVDKQVPDKQEPAQGEPAWQNWLNPFPRRAIHRGDVIVFYFPVDPSLHLVKRVIGLPGDRLRMHNGRVFVNGRPLQEPYAIYSGSQEDPFRDNFPHLQSTDPDVDSRWWLEMQHLVDHGELRIPPGHFFVLGDNRNNSEDSRYWGLVPAASVVGEPFLVYFSVRDPSEDPATLPRDGISQQDPSQPGRHRSLGEGILDAARWNRVLHVIR